MTKESVSVASSVRDQMGFVELLGSEASCAGHRFGNKGANLARARRSGLPVPNGFVVAHDAPPDLDLTAALALVSRPVAVRSSALSEDNPDRAFPGVFETVLGAHTDAQVCEAVSAVRASADADRVQSYIGGVAVDLAMAILVQELVPATSAGVAFSHDPLTGAPTVVVESGLGLGKAVVDGEITPDTYEISHSGMLIRKVLGRKRVRFDVDETGLHRRDGTAADLREYALSESQAQDVARLTVSVHTLFGFPVDIEWAFDKAGSLWLLQARPITAMPRSEGVLA